MELCRALVIYRQISIYCRTPLIARHSWNFNRTHIHNCTVPVSSPSLSCIVHIRCPYVHSITLPFFLTMYRLLQHVNTICQQSTLAYWFLACSLSNWHLQSISSKCLVGVAIWWRHHIKCAHCDSGTVCSILGNCALMWFVAQSLCSLSLCVWVWV